MKKTLIALAALAAIGSASAQVVVYGRADIGIKNDTTTGMPDKGMEVVGGGYYTSTFGIKGSTDLGGGMKASAQLESGFDPSGTGAFTSGAWGRVGKIAIEGGFGAFQLGTDWSPYDNAMNDAMDYQHMSAQAAAWNRGAHADNGNNGDAVNGNGNMSKSIQYTTPMMGGFNALIAYAPKKDAATNADVSYTGWGVNYGAGPVFVSLAGEHVPTNNQLTVATSGYTDAVTLTGSYNMGPATLFAGFEQASADATIGALSGNEKETGYSIGVKVPMGALTLSAGYAEEKSSGDLGDAKATSFSLQGLYALDKHATVYFGGRSTKDNITGTDVTTDTVRAGLTYAF